MNPPPRRPPPLRSLLLRFALLAYVPAVVAAAAALVLDTRASLRQADEALLLRANSLANAVAQRSDANGEGEWPGSQRPVAGPLGPEADPAAQQVHRLQGLLASTPDGWFAAVIDGQQTVIAREPHPEAFVGRPATAAVVEAVRGGRSGVARFVTPEGVPVVAAYQKDVITQWTAIVGVPRDTFYGPVLRKVLILGAAAAVLLAFVLAMTARLHRAISRSIAALGKVQGAGEADDGPLAFREAQELRLRLRADARRLAAANAEVDAMNRDFQRRLMARMDERLTQLGQELHDHVGATLAGLSMVLARLRLDASAVQAPVLEKAQSIAERGSDAVRRISRGLVPVGVGRGGLPHALEQLGGDLRDLHGVTCHVLVAGDFASMSREVAGHLYRIAQEAASNAVRHGKAQELWISLVRVGAWSELRAEDDGHGLPKAGQVEKAPGIGLITMRSRASAIGATIRIEPSVHGGLAVVLRWRGDGTELATARDAGVDRDRPTPARPRGPLARAPVAPGRHAG
ncbi:MAG: ATP-binding protein [Ramlibacter sp.]